MRVLVVILLFVSATFYSQNENRLTDSLLNYNKAFSYGLANTLSVVYEGTDFVPNFFFGYNHKKSERLFYDVNVVFGYKTVKRGNVRDHELIPFVIGVGLDYHFNKKNWVLGLGGDLFYSMSVRKSQLTPFQTDDYGFGVAPNIWTGYALREYLMIFTECQVAVGLYRQFVGVGTAALPSVIFKGVSTRNFSFGMKHFF